MYSSKKGEDEDRFEFVGYVQFVRNRCYSFVGCVELDEILCYLSYGMVL
jgi:hypothetical protein